MVYFLSGLTCTDENFITKSGVQAYAAASNLIVVCPDTSPRGLGLPDEANMGWDMGLGAGFYVDATQEPWSRGYRMYSYCTKELPELINAEFGVKLGIVDVTKGAGIMGHSMGGHGALVCALKSDGSLFKSVSAFAPISHPAACPWGIKAFSHYLGSNSADWEAWDASLLLAQYKGHPLSVLIDQGDADKFFKEPTDREGGQLQPQSLVAATNPLVSIQLRMQEGYDHGYYFISTFIKDHIDHHAKILWAARS